MNVPTWWEFALLGVAVYRCWRLVSQDLILNRPRAWLLRGDPPPGSATPPPGYRETVAYWLTCPFCCGAYLSVAWWAAWLVWPHGTLVAAVPFALSGAVGVFAAHLDP